MGEVSWESIKKTSVWNIFVLAHHGSPEAKGLELAQVLPPVLRAVVRHEEDSFPQLSKPVVLIRTHYLDVSWIKSTEVWRY